MSILQGKLEAIFDRLASERMRALEQILNGEEVGDGEKVSEWILKSPSLGKNLKDIHRFL